MARRSIAASERMRFTDFVGGGGGGGFTELHWRRDGWLEGVDGG